MAPHLQATENSPLWTRRQFVAASGVAALMASASESAASDEVNEAPPNGLEAIDFPGSFLYCAPTGSDLWVRVQMECRGFLEDLTTGKKDEYVLGVLAKTGLSVDRRTGQVAPGYDYVIIFSLTHVFTKRAHSTAYVNNPTVLEHKDFGEAKWRLRRVPAEAVRSAADVRKALVNWRQLTAKTTFTNQDGNRRFSVEYPIKWADYMVNGDGFRVETGPVFLLDPNNRRVGEVPKFQDFQWAHLDYRTFDSVRCLLEQPTSILADATFTPPAEHGRENRENSALSDAAVKELQDALFSRHEFSVPPETVRALFTTDHYSQAKDFAATTEIYVI